MKRFSPISFALGVVVAASVVAIPAYAGVQSVGLAATPAVPAFDGSAPTLSVTPLRFVVGTSIQSTIGIEGCEGYPANSHYMTPMQFSWTGSDAQSGMRDFQVQEVFGEAQELALTSAGPGSYGVFGQDTTSPCGGGDVGSRFRVVARDKAGNSASSAMTAFNTALVWQEDGTGVWHQPLGVAKTGVWKSSPCSCSDAQRTWYSTSAGSSIKYYLPSVSASADVAIVMGKNSNRAPVALSIDDGPVQIVDTYSPTPANRVVVWRASMSPGAHTLTVTNYATSASTRNRIDVDAVMVAPGWSPQP